MNDVHHFSLCEEVISIGKVEAIHIKTGKELGSSKNINTILYTISGFLL